MKILADGTQIIDRAYYFILDFNDSNEFQFLRHIGKQRLCDCNKKEFMMIWRHATKLNPIIDKKS